MVAPSADWLAYSEVWMKALILTNLALFCSKPTGVDGNFARIWRKIRIMINGNGCNGQSGNDPHDEIQYLQQLKMIIDKGSKKGDRTGVGTISTFGTQARYNLKDGMC